jgi:hypothetical protein
MSEPISNYLKAVRECDAAQAQVSKISDTYSQLSSAMKYKLEEFLHFNCDRRMRVTSARQVDNIVFNLQALPSGDEIKAAFAAYYDAFQAVHSAWRAIPESDRSGLKPPPQRLAA